MRDLLLGISHTDLDFATDARPDEVRQAVSGWADDLFTTGEAFGTVGIIKDGQSVEITTFRSEVYRDDSRKPEVKYASDIETDLGRRDFTVNAIALRLPEPEMVDPHNGLADLGAKVLRTPLGPEVSFGDDPLRMLRLYRFVSTLGFSATPEALAAVAAMKDRLAIVSAERIRDELSKLVVGDHVTAAFEGLVESRLADQFLPEITALAEAHDPHQRHKDVLAHTIAVVAKTSPRLELRLAALLHDVGKPATLSMDSGKVSFHHHEVVGSRMAKARMKELRYPKQVVTDVARLVYLHMRPHTYALGWTDRAVRRYVRDAGHLLEDLNELVRCDVTTRDPKRAKRIERRIAELEVRIGELRQQEQLDKIRPPIDGNDVMAYLSIEPGPLVGEALQMLMEHRLDHGPFEPEQAHRLLDDWAAAHGLEQN